MCGPMMRRVTTTPAMAVSPISTPDRPESVEYLVERSIVCRMTRRFSRASSSGASKAGIGGFPLCILYVTKCFTMKYNTGSGEVSRGKRKAPAL